MSRPLGSKNKTDNNTQPVFQRSPTERAKSFERVYAKKEEVDHDLYKLNAAALKRDIGYNNQHPILESVEHVHFYHSIDSRGNPQEFSTKIAGHFHRITIMDDGTAICSEPLMEVISRRGGRQQKSYVKVPHDNHTHEVVYRCSEKIKPVVINPEFVKLQSRVEAPISTAIGQRIDDVVEN